MLSHRAGVVLNLALSVVGLPLAAGAQNRIANGSFDADLTGWEVASFDGSTGAWSAIDAAGDPGSGSARLEEDGTTGPANSVVLLQCVPTVAAGQPYDVRTRYRGFAGSGQAILALGWNDAPGCAGISFDFDQWFSPFPAPAEWSQLEAPGVLAPAGARSVQVSVTAAFAPPEGSVVIHFDDVEFVPEPDAMLVGGASACALAWIWRTRRRPGARGA